MSLELITSIGRALAFVILYAITGFGPGLILGIILGNLTGGRGKEGRRHKHNQDIRSATEHNAQWHPSHQRWQR